jgi:hypothetical protein
VRTDVTEVGVEKLLDTAIDRAKPVSQLPVLLVVVAQQGPGDFEKVRTGSAPADRLAERREFEIDVAVQFLVPFAGRARDNPCSHTFASILTIGIKRDGDVVHGTRVCPAEQPGSSVLSRLIHHCCAFRLRLNP